MINVVGLGYIGLPTALTLSSKGAKVGGTDINPAIVEKLQKREFDFDEVGLDDIFQSAVNENIEFSTECFTTDFYIISVPTPYDKKTKKIDPTFVMAAFENVVKVCKDETIIVIESTVSPGTIDKYLRPIVNKTQKNIYIAHAPERIIPGNIVYELYTTSRIIGADTQEVGEKVKKVYQTFCQNDIIITDIQSAEMVKVVENTYRDINIAFANELCKICREANLDVYKIIELANRHPRVNILQPGPGVGGHCISVDPWFLVGDYPTLTNLILTARKVNDSMPELVIERIHTIMLENNIMNPERVGLYGITYKENTNDIRLSPTLQLLSIKGKQSVKSFKVYDPFVKESIMENQYLDLDEFLNNVDFVVIMVSHNEIKSNLSKLKDKLVLDTRHICKEDEFKNLYTL